jgi:REP element-mobilizing transposase RayT
MRYDPDIHHRRSIRLQWYDYGSAGVYFVTICVQGRECLFGEIGNGEMNLNRFGQIVQEEWQNTAARRVDVELDGFVVMPNHFHGIILLTDTDPVGARRAVPDLQPGGEGQGTVCQGTARRAPTGECFGAPVSGSLATVVRSFKSAVAKRVNALRDNPGCPVWQRNYYERVIRSEKELAAIRKYIADNPANWAEDKENPYFT